MTDTKQKLYPNFKHKLKYSNDLGEDPTNMTLEKLHDLKTILTESEIKELQKLCYRIGNSWFPVSDFFNDIRDTQNPNYDKNRAYKDLWLIVKMFLRYAPKIGEEN